MLFDIAWARSAAELTSAVSGNDFLQSIIFTQQLIDFLLVCVFGFHDLIANLDINGSLTKQVAVT